MLKTTIAAAAFVALALAPFVAVVPAAAQQAASPVQPSPVKRTQIGKTDVPGSNYEVTTAIVEVAGGFKTGRHSHPGIVQAQVLEGEFLMAIDGQPEKIYKAGESLVVPDAAIHNEGAVGTGPVKLIAVYILEKGKPLVSMVK